MPPDKSLTHRAYLLASIADGPSSIRSPLRGEDCQATLDCLRRLGLRALDAGEEVRLDPAPEWHTPEAELDCGNSGTTMRLLSGLIASRPLSATLVGDASLSRRPMGRIVEPLRRMGARIEGERPPIRIEGGELRGIDYESPVASAQVKSCLLLAGLRAESETHVAEPSLSRDHTERMLEALGVPLLRSPERPYRVGVRGGARIPGFRFEVPGDLSSAAFFMVSAAIVPGSDVILTGVGANPTRTGIFDVFEGCGIRWAHGNERVELGEPSVDVRVQYRGGLRPFDIRGPLVPRLIDEIPVLAVLATQCEGTSVVADAGELRVKESDRLARMAEGLTAMGASIEETPDGLLIHGPTPLKGTAIDAEGDHRIAMAFAVAALIASGPVEVEGAEAIATSFPSFEEDLSSLVIV